LKVEAGMRKAEGGKIEAEKIRRSEGRRVRREALSAGS